MDPTQFVLIFSLLAVTGVIVACGIWLVLVLRELKITINKTNLILDDTKMITSSVAQPISSFSQFVMGFKSGFSFFKSYLNKKNKKEE